MPICKHCGEPIHQTRGGSWVHEDGRGICSWAEPGDLNRVKFDPPLTDAEADAFWAAISDESESCDPS